MSRLACLCLAALLGALPAPAQTVSGTVLDDDSEQPVRAAVVELRNMRGQLRGSVVSDSVGVFSIPVPQAGMYRLRASRLGYRQVESPGFEVAALEAVEVNLHIASGSIPIAPLVITSRPEPPRERNLEQVGFYQRELRTSGTFVRRDRIERTNSARLSDMLSELPGVRRVMVRGVPMITLNRQHSCAPNVVIDGSPLLESARIDDIVGLRSIEAIELYRGPSETPAEFAYRENGCGVLVIWTRRRA